MESFLDGMIRKSMEMEISKQQQVLCKGKGMMDGRFMLRQLVEKRLQV